MPRKRADSAVTRRPQGRSRGRVRPPSGHRVGHTQTGRAPRALQEGSPRWGGFRLPSTPVPSRLQAFGAGGRVAAGWARPAVRGRVSLPQAASGTSDGGPRGTGAGAGRGSGRTYSSSSLSRRKPFSNAALPTISRRPRERRPRLATRAGAAARPVPPEPAARLWGQRGATASRRFLAARPVPVARRPARLPVGWGDVPG